MSPDYVNFTEPWQEKSKESDLTAEAPPGRHSTLPKCSRLQPNHTNSRAESRLWSQPHTNGLWCRRWERDVAATEQLLGQKRQVPPRGVCGGALAAGNLFPLRLSARPTMNLILRHESSAFACLWEDTAEDATQKLQIDFSIPFILLCLLINIKIKNYGTIWLFVLPLSLYYRWTSPHQLLLKNRNKINYI